MIRQRFVKPVTREPSDRKVHLRFAHQASVVHNPEEKSGEHQAHSNFGIDTRPALIGVVQSSDFLP
jgi:hypothetical protein